MLKKTKVRSDVALVYIAHREGVTAMACSLWGYYSNVTYRQ